MLDRSTAMLPHDLPGESQHRMLLFAIRRMASGGLNDAFAAQALLAGFGAGFRRPLVLLRAFMAETARVSSIAITVAPCCCPRMTEAERALVDGIAIALHDPAEAHAGFARLLHVRRCLGVVSSAQAVAACFVDRGLPLAA